MSADRQRPPAAKLEGAVIAGGDSASVAATGRGQALTKSEARELVGEVKASADALRVAVHRLWSGRGWQALGHATWDDLCAKEFSVKISLPREDRREVVSELTGGGMSARAIGSALGVSEATVRNDRGAQDCAPVAVVGTDGKTYRTQVTQEIGEPLRDLPGAEPWPVVARAFGLAERIAGGLQPNMRAWEWSSFVRSVNRGGVIVPVVITPNREIIDGRLRLTAALLTGQKDSVQFEVTEKDPRKVSYLLNVVRMHDLDAAFARHLAKSGGQNV